MTWLVLRPALVTACTALLNAYDPDNNPGDIMCGTVAIRPQEGIIDTQGKAIYDILKDERFTSEKFCEALNACIPPREETRRHGDVMTRLVKQGDVMGKYNSILEAFRKHGPPQARYERDAETSADEIRIVQLADIHVEPDYAVGSATDCGLPVCCQDSNQGSGSAGAWGDYNCNIPLETMQLFLEKTKALNPDFIIYSGDTPPHTLWDETQASQLACTKTLVDAIEQTLPGIPNYPNIGNHEMFPTNLYCTETDDTTEMNKEFATYWTPLANFTEEQQATMEEAGYYSILAKPGLRLISINTNYWYSFNFYNVLNEGMDAFVNMKQFLEDELEKARTNGEKVILVGHHPPSNGDIVVKQARWLTDLTTAYRDVIVVQLCGHTHNDEFRVIRDIETNEPSGVVFVAPSVTTKTLKNPSLRLFILDPTTFELQDYEQYNMDLLEAAASGSDPEIQKVYTAKEEFGLDDMSPQSWADFLDRMAADQEILGQYLYHYSTGAVDDPLDGCDKECQQRYLCKFGSGTHDLNVKCLRDNGIGFPTFPPDPPLPTDPSRAVPSYTVSSVLVGVMLLLVWQL